MGETLKVRTATRSPSGSVSRHRQPTTVRQGSMQAPAMSVRPRTYITPVDTGPDQPDQGSRPLDDGVTPNPAFNAIDTDVAHVANTFDADSWTTDREGYTTMTFVVPRVTDDMFFRIVALTSATTSSRWTPQTPRSFTAPMQQATHSSTPQGRTMPTWPGMISGSTVTRSL